jgi:hypothetical protein
LEESKPIDKAEKVGEVAQQFHTVRDRIFKPLSKIFNARFVDRTPVAANDVHVTISFKGRASWP